MSHFYGNHLRPIHTPPTPEASSSIACRALPYATPPKIVNEAPAICIALRALLCSPKAWFQGAKGTVTRRESWA